MEIEKLQRKFQKNPKLMKKLEDIIFLRLKLNYSKKEIGGLLEEFKKKTVEEILKEDSDKLKDINKDNTMELKLIGSWNISSKEPLFYHLDSYLVDIRRCIEFCLRMCLLNLNFKDSDTFGVEKFMNHLCKKTKNNRTDFLDKLLLEFPWFCNYLKSDSKWVYDLNEYRTDSIHYKLLNEISFKIEYFWNSVKTFEDRPEIKILRLTFLNIDLIEFINSYLSKLDFFIKNIVKLNIEIIDKNEK